MNWKKIYKFPTSNRTTINGSRYYEINNEKLPSVTEILKATESEDKKKSLLQWRQRVGDFEAEKIIKTSSTRGTLMHKYIEDYLIGQTKLDIFDNSEATVMAKKIINEGLVNLDVLWGAEATLAYPNLYAGTADACGVFNGKQTILDFKQSNKPKKREWINDYFLQVAAYALAHDKAYTTNITQGVILMCTPPPKVFYQEFLISGPEFKDYQNQFMNKVEQYNLKKNTSNHGKRLLK